MKQGTDAQEHLPSVVGGCGVVGITEIQAALNKIDLTLTPKVKYHAIKYFAW